jgi:hypothetical protein
MLVWSLRRVLFLEKTEQEEYEPILCTVLHFFMEADSRASQSKQKVAASPFIFAGLGNAKSHTNFSCGEISTYFSLAGSLA